MSSPSAITTAAPRSGASLLPGFVSPMFSSSIKDVCTSLYAAFSTLSSHGHPEKTFGANPCPTSPARRVFPAFGPAQGSGPAYEAATYDQAPSPAVLLYVDAAHFGGGGSANQGWGGQKVLWFVDPRYQGYVLVRGHQIDGPHGMRFQTRLQAPGCYAYRVDGTTFSDEIIFQAMPSTYLLLRGVTCTRSRFLGYANG
jgi:hypothetical protein